MSKPKDDPQPSPWRSGARRAPTHSDGALTIEDQLKTVLGETAGLDEGGIDHASRLREDLGLDSLDLTEVFMRLADVTGVEVADDYDFDRLQTFGDLLLLAVNLPAEEEGPGGGARHAPLGVDGAGGALGKARGDV